MRILKPPALHTYFTIDFVHTTYLSSLNFSVTNHKVRNVMSFAKQASAGTGGTLQNLQITQPLTSSFRFK